MIAIDISKQRALDADPKAIQQIKFTENLDQTGNTTFFFHYWRSERNFFRQFTRNCESIVSNLFCFNIILIQKNKI